MVNVSLCEPPTGLGTGTQLLLRYLNLTGFLTRQDFNGALQ
jgi:hypothetical protein